MTDSIMAQIEAQFDEKVKREFSPELPKEIITSIEEVENYRPAKLEDGWTTESDGWLIKTTQQEIFFGISNGQSCYERWGYISSADSKTDRDYFVGAELLAIKVIGTEGAVESIRHYADGYDSPDAAQFIELETSLGSLQFAVYNHHNGYYGHSVFLRSKSVNYDGGV